MKTYVMAMCYPAGAFGWWAVQLAAATPAFLWAGLSCTAFDAFDAYHLLLAANYALVVALQYLVAVGWNTRMGAAPPGDACNNNLRAMPDLAVWLLLHYTLLTEISRRLSRAPLAWLGALGTLANLVLVPAVLLWSHNTRPLYALAGGALGLASAALFGALFAAVVVPAFRELGWADGCAHKISAAPPPSPPPPPPLELHA